MVWPFPYCKACIFLLTVFLFLGGCSKANTASSDIKPKSYVYNNSQEAVKPCIVLEEDNTFTFTFSVLSSYIAVGNYEVKDGRLILETSDRKYKYVFKADNGKLILEVEKSSEFPSYANIPDGAVFE